MNENFIIAEIDSIYFTQIGFCPGRPCPSMAVLWPIQLWFVLFNINDPDDGAQRTLSKFVDEYTHHPPPSPQKRGCGC